MHALEDHISSARNLLGDCGHPLFVDQRINVPNGQREKLLAGVPEVCTRFVVDFQKAQRVRLEDLERVVGSVNQAPEQAKRVFAMLALRDVLRGAAETDQAAGRIALGLAPSGDPSQRAVGTDDLDLEFVWHAGPQRVFDSAL